MDHSKHNMGKMKMESTLKPVAQMDHAAHKRRDMKMDDSAGQHENDRADYDGNFSDITTNYAMLKSPTKTTLPKDAPVRIAF
jgi:hypothetical protein